MVYTWSIRLCVCTVQKSSDKWGYIFVYQECVYLHDRHTLCTRRNNCAVAALVDWTCQSRPASTSLTRWARSTWRRLCLIWKQCWRSPTIACRSSACSPPDQTQLRRSRASLKAGCKNCISSPWDKDRKRPREILCRYNQTSGCVLESWCRKCRKCRGTRGWLYNGCDDYAWFCSGLLVPFVELVYPLLGIKVEGGMSYFSLALLFNAVHWLARGWKWRQVKEVSVTWWFPSISILVDVCTKSSQWYGFLFVPLESLY